MAALPASVKQRSESAPEAGRSRPSMASAIVHWTGPLGIEDHWKRSYYGLSRWRNGPVALTALSAVDIALWDLEAKRLGVPVHRLLGAAAQPKLRAYFTHWSASLKGRTPRGVPRPGPNDPRSRMDGGEWTLPLRGTEPERIKSSITEVEAVRKGVGYDLDIGLEAAETFSIRSALQFAKALEPYRVMFFEEPTLRENPAGLGELAAKSPVPIATGEGLLSRWEFRQLLDARGPRPAGRFACGRHHRVEKNRGCVRALRGRGCPASMQRSYCARRVSRCHVCVPQFRSARVGGR